MSTKYIASNWRLPNQENSSKSDNYGLTFDGDEHITASYTGDVYACSIWFKPENTITTSTLVQYLISFGAQFDGILLGSTTSSLTDELIIIGNDNSGIGRSAYLNNGGTISDSWHHICFNWTGSVYQIWLDGVNVQNASNGTPALINASNIRIGKNSSGTDRYFNGSISEVAIFDYALTSTQISTLYGSSSLGAGNPMALKPAPVAFYPLGDNSSGNPLTQPNEAVEDASVFDFIPNDDINCGTNSIFDITENITLSGWINRDDNLNLSTIITKWNSGPTDTAYILRVGSSGGAASNSQIQMLIRNTSGVAVTATEVVGEVCINKWVHIMGTYNGSTIRLFYNGVELGSGTAQTGNIETSTAPLRIGSRGSEYTDGKMSNIAIWNSDQSSEISNIYNSGVPATSYTNTPTAWYKLDQSANWDVSSSGNWTIPDASGNGNDGTSSGMTSANLVLSDLTRAVPYDSYSFNFDGTNYITTGTTLTNLSVSTSFSISCWVNITSNVNYYHIVGAPTSYAAWDTGFGLFTNGSGIRFWVEQWNGSNQFVETSSLSNGQWYHIAATFDTTNGLKLYVNAGTPTTATGTTIDGLSNTIFIGSTGTNTTYGFNGKISNVSIFNQELTSTEVMKLYSNGVPQDLSSFSPAPVSWWTLGSNSFFNGTNYICRDLIGSNDGTSANAGVDAIVGDAPRSEANGTGTNMDVPSNLEGSTKWSDNNSWSINMSETARVEDTP